MKSVVTSSAQPRFISEPIRPDGETFDTARMAVGGPGLPPRFRWKNETIRIARVLRTWRETGPCDHGSGEAYVRKHWFEVVTDSGQTMTLYFERRARAGRTQSRWWLFTIQ